MGSTVWQFNRPSLCTASPRHPVFITWSTDPSQEVSSWAQQAYKRYLEQVCFALVCSFFAMCMATCSFAFLGRGQSAYLKDLHSGLATEDQYDDSIDFQTKAAYWA